MIQKIKLENFQSHKNSEITLTSGLNCIIGSTHVGKSALVRALRWVLFNAPIKKFITWEQTECRVTLFLDNGWIVIRERINDINRYILKNDNFEEKFESFGLSIPKKVQEILGSIELKLDEDDVINLNVRSQHDPLFLLTRSGSTKAKALNCLIGIHLIDNALNDLVSDIKKEKILDKSISDEIKLLEQEIKNYDDLSIQEEKLKKSFLLLKELKKMKIDLDNLTQLQDEIICINNKIEKWKSQNIYFKKFNIVTLELYEKTLLNYKQYKNLQYEVSEFDKRILNYEQKILKLKKYNIKQINQQIEYISRYLDLIPLKNEINEYFGKVEKHHKNVENIKIIEFNTKERYIQIIKQLEKCPICFSILDSNKIEKIIEKL